MPLFSPPQLPQQRRQAPPPSSQVVASGVGSAAGTSTATAIAPFGAGAAAGTSTVAAVGASLASGVGSASGTSTATATTNNIFPLSVSANGRYLKQNNGTPFLIAGQSVWSLGVNLPIADLSSFLTTITGQGFNTVLFNAIEHHYTIVKAPKERAGLLPFSKRLDGATYTGSPNGTASASGTQGQFGADDYSSIGTQAPDPTFPTNTYWQAIESVLNACLAQNVLVFVWPAYLGFHAQQEGWLSEMVAWDAVTGAGGFTGQPWADPTKSKMWNYGAWLADRWKSYPNIIWVAGGDYGSNSQTLSTPQRNAVTNFVIGMKSVSGQASVLWTAHWDRPCISNDTTLSGVTWNLNLAYADEAVAETCRLGYADAATIPTFLGEYNYEDGLFGGSAPWRKYLYWGFLGGISGGFFGNEPLWRVDTDYATHMNTQAVNDAARQFAFWRSKPWHRLRPNGLGSIGTLITAGGGTASPQSTDYVAAAATPEGDLLLAYMPPAHTGSATVDMSKMSATAQARWFDPSNATFTNIGAFNNTGTHAFTTPGNNNAGDADWLLLLETNSGTAAGSSTATAVGASVAATTGSATGTGTATAQSQVIAAAIGISSGTSTATAISATILAGTGAAVGTGTATAVGAALANTVGSSSGAATATAVGQSTGAGSGTSTGASTVSAIGASLADGVGTATGSGIAAGTSASTSAGVGASTGTSTATAVGSAVIGGAGTTAGIGIVAAVGSAIADGAGTSSGTGTATAVGASTTAATGTSSGTSTAIAAGNVLVVGIGVSAGTSTATAIGQSIAAGSGTGVSAGTSAATAIGAALSSGVGASIGGSTANSVSASLAASSGSSAGVSTANGIIVSAVFAAGVAAGTSTATAVGEGSTSGSATGTSAGTSTATGVGASLAAATGFSAGVGTAFGSSTLDKPAFQVPVIRGVRPVSSTPLVKLRRRS